MALTSKMRLNINISYTSERDLGIGTHVIAEDRGLTLTDGTGANKGNNCWDDTRSLDDGANETIDVQSLTGAYGTLNFSIIRQLYIRNNSEDSGLKIGGAASTQLGIFDDGASDKLTIGPLGERYWTWPDATGLDTTINKDLKLEHDSAGAAVALTYDIIVCGEAT